MRQLKFAMIDLRLNSMHSSFPNSQHFVMFPQLYILYHLLTFSRITDLSGFRNVPEGDSSGVSAAASFNFLPLKRHYSQYFGTAYHDESAHPTRSAILLTSWRHFTLMGLEAVKDSSPHALERGCST